MRIFKQIALWTLVVVVLLWPADWAVWRVAGSPMATVEVTRFVVAPLKGGKEEYYQDGTEVVDCSRSALPEAGQGTCWWVERHRVVYER